MFNACPHYRTESQHNSQILRMDILSCLQLKVKIFICHVLHAARCKECTLYNIWCNSYFKWQGKCLFDFTMKHETLTHLFSRATDTSSSRKKTAESSSKRVPSVWWCSGPLDANVSAFISSNSESWRKNLDSENSCSGWHSYTGWESDAVETSKC